MKIGELSKVELTILKFVFETHREELIETEEQFVDRNKANAFFKDMIDVVETHYDPNIEIGGSKSKPSPAIQIQISEPDSEYGPGSSALFKYDPNSELQPDSEENFLEYYSDFSKYKRIFDDFYKKISRYTDIITDEEVQEICKIKTN